MLPSPLQVRPRVVTDDLRRLHRHLLVITAVLLAVLALALALGWESITRGRPEWPQIYPYSIAGAAALVAAMALLSAGPRIPRRVALGLALTLSGATVILGAGTDIAVAAGLLPAADATTGSGGWSAALPSIAATAAALTVALIPVSAHRWARVRFWTAAAAGVVSLLILLSYVYGSNKLILGLGLTGTSLPMSIVGLLIVGASMSARPDLPPLTGLDTYYDASLLRRVLPLLILAPFVPALLHGLVGLVEPDRASADAISQLASVVILVTVIVLMGGGASRARRDLALQRQRVWSAFEHAPAGTAVISIDGYVVTANAALERLAGQSPLTGTLAIDLVADQDAIPVAESLAEVAAGRNGFRRDVRLRNSTGVTTWVDLSLAPVRDVSGRVTYLVLQVEDLTDRKNLERVLAERAIRDPLTGLLNREGLEQQISGLRRLAREGHDVVVVFADVDGLKALNDTAGHDAGDALLREVGRRLRVSTRDEDVVARIGGDEFVIVTTVPATGQASADAVVERLRRDLTGSVPIDGRKVPLSVSLGASTLGTLTDTQTAIGQADKAMYADKQLRRRSTDRP
jgi:diguanylate cyclase (GGDEF)-like protein/PAS domain S-box-containing protein